jgi:RNA polymerase sigma-70 factor (ECF subfamily)
VHRLLGRVAGRQDADDLTQIVFTKAARAFPRFRGDARISTWLNRIAANVAADWLRGRALREAKQTVQLPEVVQGQGGSNAAVPDPQPSPEQRLIRKQMREFIRGEIGRLPKANRAAFILGELGGLNHEEVAQALGISLANTKVRLHRARVQLKTAIAARRDFYRTELSCAPNSPGCCPPAAPSSSAPTDQL